MSKHTPGPWFLSEKDMSLSEDDVMSIGVMTKTGADDDESTCVTSVSAFGVASYEEGGVTYYGATAPDAASLAVAHANARLIAAAPDLLEALRAAVRQNDNDMLMTGEELRACRASIAKAEGAQQ